MEWKEPAKKRAPSKARSRAWELLPEAARVELRENPGRWALIADGEVLTKSQAGYLQTLFRVDGFESTFRAVIGDIGDPVRHEVYVRAPELGRTNIQPHPEAKPPVGDKPDLVRDMKDLPRMTRVSFRKYAGHVYMTYMLPDSKVSMGKINTAAVLMSQAELLSRGIAVRPGHELKVNHEDRTITVTRELMDRG